MDIEKSVQEGAIRDEVPQSFEGKADDAKSNDQLMQEAQARVKEADQPPPPPEPEQPKTDWEAKYQKSVVEYGKQNKENRVMQQQLQQMQEQMQQQAQIIESLKDPNAALETLKSHGTDYQALTNAVVGAEEPPTPEQQEIAELKSQVAALNEYKTQLERQALEAQQQASRTEAETYTKQFLQTNKDKYPFLASQNAYQQFIAEYQRQVDLLGPNPPALPDEHAVAAAMEQAYKQAVSVGLANQHAAGILQKQLEPLGYVLKPANSEQTPEQTPDQQADSTVTNPEPAPPPVTLSNADAASAESREDFEKVYQKGQHYANQYFQKRAKQKARQVPGGSG